MMIETDRLILRPFAESDATDAYEYLKADCDQPDSFPRAMAHLAEIGLSLAGAVHDFTDPRTGRNYLMIPIRKI